MNLELYVENLHRQLVVAAGAGGEEARALAERPPERMRVLFLSTSEEATCEGIHHFARRHFPELPRERTFFLCLDTVGSPHL